jgi:hypothetical protein
MCAGLTSAVMMLPVNIFLITIFKIVRPRYARNLYHVHLDTLQMHMALRVMKDKEFAELQRARLHSRSIMSDLEDQYIELEPVLLDKLPSYQSVVTCQQDPEVVDEEKSIRELARKNRQAMQSSICWLPWWCVYFNWVRKASSRTLY